MEISAARLPLPLRAQQLPTAGAKCLPIMDAWAIAMQWKDSLRDKVRLQRTSDESVGVAKSYAWIRFEIDMSRHKVSAARAAAVTWFALSCCPGYGGHENPAFWKNVFSEMVDLYVGRPDADESITDAYGFFDGDGVDFPRFQLKVAGNEASALLFCGSPGEKLEADDTVKLAQVMESLAPWIDHERTVRRPEVSLVDAYSTFSWVVTGNTMKHEAHRPKEWPLARFISESNRSTGSGWPSPVFVVKELDIYGLSFWTGPTTKQQWFHEIMQRHETEICEFSCNSTRAIPRDELAMIVRDVLCLPGSDARARTKSLSLNVEDQFSLPAFASALPMTTCIRSVWIGSHYSPRDKDVYTSIVWIAYALFHPDTPTSPWKSLIFKNTLMREQAVTVLQAMARGNNLMAMLEGREPTSDGYYRARLAADAIVYDQHGTSANERSTQTVVFRSDGNLEVEVCDVASEDSKTWGEWVAVVVPAYGLGWVRSAAITSVLKRAPAEASTTRLKMSASGLQLSRYLNTLGRVLSLIGRRLVHLDIGWYAKFSSSADLLQALSCCPSLESLAIQYEIEVWDSEAVASVLPSLRELELCLQDVHLAAFDVPTSLHLLRINAVASRGAYDASADAIRHILMQASSQLRVFHWRDGYTAVYFPYKYWSTCLESSKRLDALDIPRKCAECVDTRLPASCVAAFLSVVSQPGEGRPDSGVARLDKWVAMNIVAFAGSGTTRSVVIEPTVQEVVQDPHYINPNLY